MDSGTDRIAALLEILQCPLGRQPLTRQGDWLVCPCQVRFPIRDGIPVMVVEEAEMPGGVANFQCRQSQP